MAGCSYSFYDQLLAGLSGYETAVVAAVVAVVAVAVVVDR